MTNIIYIYVQVYASHAIYSIPKYRITRCTTTRHAQHLKTM